jgi:hypothetical protein
MIMTSNHRIKGLSQEVSIYRHSGKDRLEYLEQSIGVSWFDYNYPKLRLSLIHVPNETQSTPQYQQRLNEMGRRKGCSDLLLLVSRGGYPYACIEFKKKGGSVSAVQKEFLNHHLEQGAFVAVVFGEQAFKKMIKEYLQYV